MIPLLELALDAHGGLTRWRQVKSIDLKLSIGGQLWRAKGLPQGLNVALHVEPSRKLVVLSPFDGEDSTGYFTPDRVWVENAANRSGVAACRWPAFTCSSEALTRISPVDPARRFYDALRRRDVLVARFVATFAHSLEHAGGYTKPEIQRLKLDDAQVARCSEFGEGRQPRAGPQDRQN